ncbi:uncharacterized protein LOC122190877 isoform X2 [Lagopus leucura]|uniref:uncharacterized protein LOC122190877 isoform X2 n=1 Tax=Lagopus leucura TaxID=30410 RepID=UPI001C664C67|nr:uncharacterized protein LOC122190877 isoform X2 [Lagopus leucura]XP_042746936.1 uncharacterized protein LOC122190877 isoform X2 [Lagopus leucura]XP_042746937.1 uncharacterized protein LOC122190877 isoform X2 [Lagopus leucura]
MKGLTQRAWTALKMLVQMKTRLLVAVIPFFSPVEAADLLDLPGLPRRPPSAVEHGGAEREWLRNGVGTQGSHRCCVTNSLSGLCKLLLPSPASGAMLKLEETFPGQVEKMAQLQVLFPSLLLESSLLESRRAAGCLLCGCCGHFSQLRSPSPRWQKMCCATISSVGPLCSCSALAAIVPVSRCHKPDWRSLGTQTWETVKKAKASAALLRKEAQKKSKKN